MRHLLCILALSVAVASASAQPVQHWRLDESAGTTVHNSVTIQDGQLRNAPSPVWQPTLGLDGALQINNDNDGVACGTIDLGQSFTISGWCKPIEQSARWGRFVNTSHMSGCYLGFKPVGADNNWGLLIQLAGPTGMNLTGPAVTYNQWQHVVAVYDYNLQRGTLYVNGVGYGPVNASPPSIPVAPMFFGKDTTVSPAILGLYDDIALYHEALTGAEIQTIYNQGLAGHAINHWQAKNPSPADNTIDIPIDVTLSWSAGVDPPQPIANHILYYGTSADDVMISEELDPNGNTVVVSLPAGTTSYTPGLANDKTIYWRVDEKINAANVARGAIWQFDTRKLLAVITQQPTNQRAFPAQGDSATFTVEAQSESPVNYQWYKDDAMLADDAKYSGAQSAALTVNNVETTDAGEYYVILTNNSGPVTSDVANLVIKDLIGHWPFDGNAQDASVHANHGYAPETDPNYVVGVIGSAAKFVALDHTAIEIPNEAHFDEYEEFSVSLWVNAGMNQLNVWANVIGKGGNNGGWNVNMNNGTAQLAAHIDVNPDLANNDTPTFVGGDVPVFDNNWHLVNFTYDGATERIYVDGALVQSGPVGHPAPNDIPLMIGASRTGATGATVTAYINALIDDVRMYNYALTGAEIAQAYYDVTGIPTCVAPGPAADLDGDCIVDLRDFAVLTMEWLDCGIVPAIECWQ